MPSGDRHEKVGRTTVLVVGRVVRRRMHRFFVAITGHRWEGPLRLAVLYGLRRSEPLGQLPWQDGCSASATLAGMLLPAVAVAICSSTYGVTPAPVTPSVAAESSALRTAASTTASSSAAASGIGTVSNTPVAGRDRLANVAANL